MRKKFKGITHVLAAGLGIVVAFLASPAGQVLAGQYRWLAVAAAGAAAAAGVYHQPKSAS